MSHVRHSSLSVADAGNFGRSSSAETFYAQVLSPTEAQEVNDIPLVAPPAFAANKELLLGWSRDWNHVTTQAQQRKQLS
jgi:hypothetical protein